MNKEINVLIPYDLLARDLAQKVLSSGFHKEDLFDSTIVKIGPILKLNDISNDHLIDSLNHYLDRYDDFKMLTKFSVGDKFDYIVIDASSVEKYGINNFPTEDEVKKIMKENAEIIIDTCRACSRCDNYVKARYSNLNLKLIHQKEKITKYILSKALAN
ncbi:hypothetical protein KC866_00865 [Patescibacteria group bacterium]|nr:hypothetical protein [Patescibacteria group bacterium]